MTSEIGSVIADVDAAVGSADARRRREMLDKVAGLFAEEAARLKADQVAAFDAVIVRLAQGAGPEARAGLSERLAGLPNAPSMMVRDLAFDPSAEIAGPLLRRSSRLSEDDLLQLAQNRGQGHLLAIAQRATLAKPLAELLIQRGDGSVARAIAGNGSVFLSERAYAVLMRRATSDPVLRAELEKRGDVSPSHRKRLSVLAQEQDAQMLDEAFGWSAQEALMADSAAG